MGGRQAHLDGLGLKSFAREIKANQDRRILMENAQFVAYLDKNGVGTQLATTRPQLFSQLAKSWRWTCVSSRSLDLAFIGSIEGPALSVEEAANLRQIAGLHAVFRDELVRRAPREILRPISEDRVAEIEREQRPVTASMVKILNEAHELIRNDDLRAIVFLRTNAIDINQKDRDGMTSCAVAAKQGAAKCLFGLCKNIANPHVSDILGNTPLHWACAMEQPKSLSMLLYHGANANSVSHSGVTPLMLALMKSNFEMAQKLLEHGADLRLGDKRGNTALHRAVLAKNLLVSKFLLECGASSEAANMDGATPLGLAMKAPDFAVMFCGEQARSLGPRAAKRPSK